MQVITKNSSKTTTVLWTANLPCYAFVRSLMFFSRCVKGCLEQLRWEPYFNINNYWQRLYKHKIDLLFQGVDSLHECEQC